MTRGVIVTVNTHLRNSSKESNWFRLCCGSNSLNSASYFSFRSRFSSFMGIVTRTPWSSQDFFYKLSAKVHVFIHFLKMKTNFFLNAFRPPIMFIWLKLRNCSTGKKLLENICESVTISHLVITVGRIGWILWHINPYKLSNAKFCLYIYWLYDL